MTSRKDAIVGLRAGAGADAELLRAEVEAAGFRVSDSARLWVLRLGERAPAAMDGCWIALVPDEEAALAALRAGACDALVWPAEVSRLHRALVASMGRVADAVGHHIYREVFRRSRSWLELADDAVRLVDVSRGFEEQTGYPRQDAVGKTPAELFRGGTHGEAFYQRIAGALARDARWGGDMLSRRRDGSLAVVRADIGRIEGPGGVFAQYADKRAVAEAGHSSLAGWVETHVADPWLLVERRAGAVLEVGNRLTEVLVADRATLLAKPFAELGLSVPLPPPGEASVCDQWIGPRAFELTATGREAGDAQLVLIVLRDVTERLRRAEQLDALAHDLAMARDQAMSADRAKSAFLAGMSHELRTPLTAILGYAELLADELQQPRFRSDLGRITVAGKHLLSLVDDVLDLARVESGEVKLDMKAFPVRGVLEEVADSVRLRARARGLELHIDPNASSLRVWGDRQRTLQVVLNLVVNAVKYAVPGRIVVGGEEGADGRRGVFVQDEGPGLTPREQQRMFHAFRQLHDVSDGVGLGLAISRRLAEAMGGSLDVVSAPGEGSRFRLWLAAPNI